MTHTTRVYQPLRCHHIEQADVREWMEAGYSEQIGFYIVSSGLHVSEADFLGVPLAVLAVVDDFGNLKRVTA